MLLPLVAVLPCLVLAFALPATPQIPFNALETADKNSSTSLSFSRWAKRAKRAFLDDLERDKAHDWVVVMGNEAADMDSTVSALAWAYQLSHSPKVTKAVAMLQIDNDAIDLRKENAMVLKAAHMDLLHGDLLTIDDLPVKPWDLYHRIRGVALVDHNPVRTLYGNITVLSIMDHHADRNQSLHAEPRIIEPSSSASSIVARQIFRQRDSAEHPKDLLPLPRDLVDLLLRTMAMDTKGYKKKKRTSAELEAMHRLWPLSSWAGEKQKKRMKSLYKKLAVAEADLNGLTTRDLLRRDYKGDSIPTQSKAYPALTVGFASVPISMGMQIKRTPEATVPEYFAIIRAWTSETQQDVTVVISKSENSKGEKIRELALIVAHGFGTRLNIEAADSLFSWIRNDLEKSSDLNLTTWIRPDGLPLLPRRAVWVHDDDQGRKWLRPYVESAVKSWPGPIDHGDQ